MPFFVALTLQESRAVVCAVYGQFSKEEKRQEVAIARVGGVLELLRLEDGKVRTVGAPTKVFSTIRSLKPIRLTGSSRDYLVVGSDSGAVALLEFDSGGEGWTRVHLETFGKTGCRRAVPGQYVAADPKGRAFMVAAVEKQKFVYILNRDASQNVTISSPLEAHKANTLAFDCCGLDVGFENPVFAVLELDLDDDDAEKMLTNYELDLGLNHVTRRWSEPVSRTANLLVPVPNVSGVLVCAENWIAYKRENHVEVRTPIPRRHDFPDDRGLLITASCSLHQQKGQQQQQQQQGGDLSFFLILTEIGDLCKVVLKVDDQVVTDVIVTVFDSIFPCVSLCITRTGLLFAAAEFGDHALFQFQGIGDDALGVATATHDPELGDDALSASKVAPKFTAKAIPTNLALVDEVECLAAPTTFHVVAPETLLFLCGGHRPSLRLLKRGVAVSEMAVSELPGRPSAVWTVKAAVESAYDKYIVVSFANATLVLSIGETVEEVTDSGFLATSPTLEVALLADNAVLQVHSAGIRHVRPDKRVNEWQAPNPLERASANERQVVVSVGGEVIYFELDASGTLAELGTHDLSVDVACVDLAPVQKGRLRTPFLGAGCFDSTFRLLSLDPNELFAPLASIQLGERPETVRFLSGYAFCGLRNGVLQRVTVDESTGRLHDARSRFLGARAVRLFRVLQTAQPSLIALSSKPWLVGGDGESSSSSGRTQQQQKISAICYDALECAASFQSEQCPEGIVAIAGSTLRIFVNDYKPEQIFNSTILPTRYTPRRVVDLPSSAASADDAANNGKKKLFLVIEADQNRYTEAERRALFSGGQGQGQGGQGGQGQGGQGGVQGGGGGGPASQSSQQQQKGGAPNDAAALAAADDDDDAMDIAVDDDDEEVKDDDDEEAPQKIRIVGPTPPRPGHWASCLRVVDGGGETLELLELGEAEAALSVATVTFAGRGGEVFVAVGTATALEFGASGRSHRGCAVHVYRLLDARLVLLHKTPLEDVPLALCDFRGRLLVSVGRAVRLYDLGKRKLLRKTEHSKLVPNLIVKLDTRGDRIYAADATESVFFAKYVRETNKFAVFADDPVARSSAALCVLDYDTVALSDKFGNLAILRLPPDADDDVEDPSGTSSMFYADGYVGGGAGTHKLLAAASYHVGSLVVALAKSNLGTPGADDALFYATVDGAIGALVPARSRDDKDFYSMLEMHLRQDYPHFLTGRDHISFRSAFVPVNNVVDGDLCDLYALLPTDTQQNIASDLDRTPNEVTKKIDETKHRLL